MPIYEYKCDVCGEYLEVIRKTGDKKPQACPKCRAVMRKVLSSAAIQFKGSGWYVTDYAKKTGLAGKDKPAACAEKKEPAKKTDGPSSD
ncbi:MAG: zinc ribbon domain-containing protein [Candidatus Aminicenantes bacterium]|nr:zinc ribbon domain-containing protein [Candidatus Aminicenantes bacterium]